MCSNGNLDEDDEEDEDDMPVTRRNNESKEANKRRRVSDEGTGEGGLEAGALAIGMDYDLDIDFPSTSAPASNGDGSLMTFIRHVRALILAVVGPEVLGISGQSLGAGKPNLHKQPRHPQQQRGQ